MTNVLRILILIVELLLLRISAKNNFRGEATSYGIHLEANGLSTKLTYDLPSARVQANPSKDWKVTNNNAHVTSLLTPVAMTLYETHPKFDMKGTWPKYKVILSEAQKPKKRLLGQQSLHKVTEKDFNLKSATRQKQKKNDSREIVSAQSKKNKKPPSFYIGQQKGSNKD